MSWVSLIREAFCFYVDGICYGGGWWQKVSKFYENKLRKANKAKGGGFRCCGLRHNELSRKARLAIHNVPNIKKYV